MTTLKTPVLTVKIEILIKILKKKKIICCNYWPYFYSRMENGWKMLKAHIKNMEALA